MTKNQGNSYFPFSSNKPINKSCWLYFQSVTGLPPLLTTATATTWLQAAIVSCLDYGCLTNLFTFVLAPYSLFSIQQPGQSLQDTSQIIWLSCSNDCNDCPSLSELKPKPLEWLSGPYMICPWFPTRIWTSSPTSTSWPLLPPCSSLNILSTVSCRGLCTPDLPAWRLFAPSSVGHAFCLLSGLHSNIISHWRLPWLHFFFPKVLPTSKISFC